MRRHTLPNKAKLKHRKLIQALFSGGQSYGIPPIRAIWIPLQQPATSGHPVIAGFSAPKKSFKRAVHRNKLKRQLRELWRLQREILLVPLKESQPGCRWAIMFIYTGKTLLPYAAMETSFKALLKKLARKMPVQEPLP